jgi:hypothetical protein
MAKWNGDVCGYCGHTAPSLDRYECPTCKRTGCPSCMPEAGLSKCDQCQEADKQTWVLGNPGSQE